MTYIRLNDKMIVGFGAGCTMRFEPKPMSEAGVPPATLVRLRTPHDVYEAVYYTPDREALMRAVLAELRNGARVIDLPQLVNDLYND